MVDQRVKTLARRMGVKLWRRDTVDGPHWNGKTVALLNDGQEISASDTIHELAHWFVSDRRSEVNFGLGSSPEDHGPTVMVMGAQDEELLASAVGILIEKRLGMDWKSTAEIHNWYDWGGPRGIAETVRAAGITVAKSGLPQRMG